MIAADPTRVGRSAVSFGVLFGGVVVMVGRMQRMAVGDFRVVRRFFVMPGLMVLCGFAMMLCRFVVMVSGFFMMLVDVVIHDPLLAWDAAPLQAIMNHLRPGYGSRK
jgi:hypothetical protein